MKRKPEKTNQYGTQQSGKRFRKNQNGKKHSKETSFQPKIIKMFLEDMPKLTYANENHKYLDKKMEEVYSKNINLLTTKSDDIKELEEE